MIVNQWEIPIISRMASIYKKHIPPRFRNAILNLENEQPGLRGESIKSMLEIHENLRIGEKNIIVLSGPVGCGKTYASIMGGLLYDWKVKYYDRFMQYFNEDDPENTFQLAWEEIEMSINASCCFQFETSTDLIETAKRGDVRDKINSRRLLVIDDLGREYFTDSGFGMGVWDTVFDSIYRNARPTIITTNMVPKEFETRYNPRIFDRLRESATWNIIKENSLRKG